MNVAAVVFTLKNKLLVVQELYFKPNLLISKLTALKKKLKRNLNIKNIEKKVNFFDLKKYYGNMHPCYNCETRKGFSSTQTSIDM